DEFAELVKRRLQRADELAAECGDADALDTVIGEDLHSEEFAQHAGHRRSSDQGLLERKTDKVDLDLLDFHFCPGSGSVNRSAICPNMSWHLTRLFVGRFD